MSRRFILGSITYKPGWSLHCEFKKKHTVMWWQFSAQDYSGGTDLTYKEWCGRRWTLPIDASEDALVKTALAAALQTEEHECREAFTYKGVRLFDPHLTVQKLMEASCPST